MPIFGFRCDRCGRDYESDDADSPDIVACLVRSDIILAMPDKVYCQACFKEAERDGEFITDVSRE